MAITTVKRNVFASTASNSSVIGTFTGKCCDAAVFNNNDMKLNRELFENLFASDEYKDAMEHRYYIGFLGHPEDPACQDFKDGCIVMTSCKITDDDEIEGTFDLVNTPVGQIVKSFIDAGVKFGISIRGAGDVDAEGNVDPDTFIFRGFDLVAFPAYNDAVPEFTAIAASKNLDDQVKYKRVCATVNKNLKDVTSKSSIDVIQSQFKPDTAEYKALQARKADLGVSDEECDTDEVCINNECKEEVLAKKLRCMTDMYLEACEEIKSLKKIVSNTRAENRQIKANYDRQLKSIRRITASQNTLMQSKLDSTTAELSAVRANSKKVSSELSTIKASHNRLKAECLKANREINSLNKSNLIYKQKVESSSNVIKDNEATISELQTKLNKTVVASKQISQEASNCDEKIKKLHSEITASSNQMADLQSQVTATTETLQEYQQAYADMYAIALGTHVSGLPVTATTTVRELENLIQCATNTSNIAAMPAVDAELVSDEYEVENESSTEDGLVTL